MFTNRVSKQKHCVFNKVVLSSLSLSSIAGILAFITIFIGVVDSQLPYWDSFLKKSEIKGSFCASRPKQNQCCSGRRDNCGVPMPEFNTMCYCDEFCNLTHPRGYDDCCPDYLPICLNIPISEPIKTCYYKGRIISEGELQKINCNECKCVDMGNRMELVCDHQECLINTTMIDIVNHNWRFGWTATNYSEFWGRYLSEGITSRLGTFLSTKKVRDMIPISPDYDYRTLPKSFDSRSKWRGHIEPPRDQGWCGASWAISTTSVISDRLNIQLGSYYNPLSPQHLLSCNTRNQPGSGCSGGHLTRAWIFIRKFGLVQEDCFPWVGTRTKCDILKRKAANESRCASNSHMREKSPLYRVAPIYRIEGEHDIMYEIQNSGPVQAVMQVYQDFFSYKEGIYKCTSLTKDQRTGYHAVRIIGWGEDYQNNIIEKYWIVANSWGPYWGENGYFRIRRGNNDCNIEKFIVAAWVAKVKTPSINYKDTSVLDNTIDRFKK